jgi:hypothetical protein
MKRWGRVAEYDIKNMTCCLDKCLDVSFNYCIVGVAILSMSKRMMNRIFAECDEPSILVYMSNTDSLMVPTAHIPRLSHHIGDAMGSLKVEKASDDAIVIRANLYYMSDSHYRSSGIPHSQIEATGDVMSWFAGELDPCSSAAEPGLAGQSDRARSGELE